MPCHCNAGEKRSRPAATMRPLNVSLYLTPVNATSGTRWPSAFSGALLFSATCAIEWSPGLACDISLGSAPTVRTCQNRERPGLGQVLEIACLGVGHFADHAAKEEATPLHPRARVLPEGGRP
eukprot:564099-Pyramimonas_sp.AAC.1